MNRKQTIGSASLNSLQMGYIPSEVALLCTLYQQFLHPFPPFRVSLFRKMRNFIDFSLKDWDSRKTDSTCRFQHKAQSNAGLSSSLAP